MNCTDLTSEIARLSGIIAVSKFSMSVANAYNNQLALAKTTSTSKCSRSTNEPLVLIPSTDIGGGGGGIGGGGFGGGGGIGEPPPSDEIIEEEKKGGINGLLLILGVVGVLYFLNKKSS
jgi:hypothetical protein